MQFLVTETLVKIDPTQIEQIKGNFAIYIALIAAGASILVAFLNSYFVNRKNKQDANIAKDKIEADDIALIKKIRADILTQSSKTYKELITTERISWIGLLRESMTIYIANAEKLLILGCLDTNDYPINADKEIYSNQNFIKWNSDFKKNNASVFCEFKRAEALIQLRLNPFQENHKILVSEMHNLTAMIEDKLFIGNKEDIAKDINHFRKCCQELLKSEWEHSKDEAKKNLLTIEEINIKQLLNNKENNSEKVLR